MAKRPRRNRSTKPASANTTGMKLLSAIIAETSVSSLRDVDPEVHLDDDERGFEQRAYNFIRAHHDEHRVLPSRAIIEDNTGIVLPDTDEPVAYHFRRVRERSLTRNIMDPYNRLQEALQNPKRMMQEAEEAIDDMYRAKSRFLDAGTGIETSDTLLDEIVAEMEMRRMSSGVLRGIPTGYQPLDHEMDGYNRGDLVVWVGRPGRSKSWFLLKQCHAAWSAGYKPLYISMEMGGVQNMRRILGIHSGINPTFIKRGAIQTLARPNFDQKLHELMELRPLQMVTANFSRTVDQIANFIETHNPDIVFIDAGYLLSPKKKRFGSGGRRETISDVIEELKELAANTDRPFVLTVQFNRQAEHRRRAGGGGDAQSFNPIAHLSLAEIGETDVIGQTATHVLGIEFPPAPLQVNSHRVFGFLKGREGENGWWLTKFMQSQQAPVDLSLVSPDDPAYRAIMNYAAEQASGAGGGGGRRDPRAVAPERRTALMQLNGAT